MIRCKKHKFNRLVYVCCFGFEFMNQYVYYLYFLKSGAKRSLNTIEDAYEYISDRENKWLITPTENFSGYRFNSKEQCTNLDEYNAPIYMDFCTKCSLNQLSEQTKPAGNVVC